MRIIDLLKLILSTISAGSFVLAAIVLWRSPRGCPKCGLLKVEAIDTNCHCDFATK